MAVPKIRIKGYTDEWNCSTVGNVANVVGGGTPSTYDNMCWGGSIQWFTPSEIGKDKYVQKSERTITKVGLEQSSAKLIPVNSILLTSRATIGEMSINLCECATNQGFQSLIPNGVNLDFLYALMKTKQNTLIRESSGSTFLEISANKVRSMEISIPNTLEQEAIGSYFQSLDSLIEATDKKIATLKQTKQASLQSMFPKEGETKPRVRFKGFTDEWKKVQLSDCLEISSEKNLYNEYGVNNVLSVSDEVGVVNQIEFLGRSYAGKSVTNYKVLRTNQIVYTKSPLKAKPYGIVKVNKGSVGIVSVLYAVYDTKENVYPDYIHYYFDPSYRINNYLLLLINKGAKNTMNISDEVALTGKICIPSYEEQKQIAEYFSNLDKQISIQEQRLEKLKQIKSACLKNMFV